MTDEARELSAHVLALLQLTDYDDGKLRVAGRDRLICPRRAHDRDAR